MQQYKHLEDVHHFLLEQGYVTPFTQTTAYMHPLVWADLHKPVTWKTRLHWFWVLDIPEALATAKEWIRVRLDTIRLRGCYRL